MNIFCIEQNYFANAQAQQNEPARAPVIFMKPQSALLLPGMPFSYPEFAHELYCGCELVLRICESGKNVEEKLAYNYYDLISVGINFTAISSQGEPGEAELTWEMAKAWDNSSIRGEWMNIANFNDKKDINFCLYKNRELVQLGNSGLLVNDFDIIISAVSGSFPINSGDLIFTGTPVGIGRLAAGDRLEAFIEDDSLLEFDVE